MFLNRDDQQRGNRGVRVKFFSPTWLYCLIWCLAVAVAQSGNTTEEQGETASEAPAEGVVLLHGLARSAASMKRMEEALEEAGYVVLNKGYRSREAVIAVLSEEAVGEALRDPLFEGVERIHFVTHSLGGILVRDYFSRHKDPRLGRVVMLGPPNAGSEVVDELQDWRAFQWLNGPAGQQLGTGEDSVPVQLGPVDFELGVIAGTRSINWINSFMIDGSDDGKVSVENSRIEGMAGHIAMPVTHPGMMRNRKVIEQTLEFLRNGRFAETDD